MECRARKRGSVSLVCGLAAALLAVAVPSAIAAPAWVEQHALSGDQTHPCFFDTISMTYFCYGSVLRPDVALAADGALSAVWTRGSINNGGDPTSIMSLGRPPGGAYAAPDEVAAATASGGQVDAGNGQATAAWQRSGDVEGALAPAGGTFGSAFPIVSSAQLMDLDVAPNGAAIAAFLKAESPGNYKVNVSYRPPGGSFGPAEPVSDTSTTFYDVATAIDANGDAVIAWMRAGATTFLPEFASRPAAGPPDPAVVLANVAVQHIDVAINDDGDAAVVWYANDWIAHARYRPAGGALGPDVPLSDAADSLYGLDVAVNEAGDVLAMWGRDPQGAPPIVTEWSFRPAGGSFSPAATFPGAGGAVPRVQFWPDGDALAIWIDLASGKQLYSAIRPPGGSFGQTIPVLTGLATRQIFYLSTALDPAGNAAVAWVEYQGGNTPTETDQAWVAGFDGAPPVLRNIVVPGTARPGQSLDFSAQRSDVWSSVSPISWEFGDGGSDTGGSVAHAYDSVGEYTVEISATDGLGQTATRTRTVAVSNNPATGPVPDGGDVGAPVVRRFRLTHKVFRVGRRKTRVNVSRERPPRGTKFKFRSSEAGRATLTIQQRKKGHWRTRRPKLKRPVTKGKNRIRFTGRYGDRKLKPGRYRAKLRVKDADGNRSAVKKARFRVVR